jgi:hypothetical protein
MEQVGGLEIRHRDALDETRRLEGVIRGKDEIIKEVNAQRDEARTTLTKMEKFLAETGAKVLVDRLMEYEDRKA